MYYIVCFVILLVCFVIKVFCLCIGILVYFIFNVFCLYIYIKFIIQLKYKINNVLLLQNLVGITLYICFILVSVYLILTCSVYNIFKIYHLNIKIYK